MEEWHLFFNVGIGSFFTDCTDLGFVACVFAMWMWNATELE